MPWFDAYEAAPGRPTGLHPHAAGCICTCPPPVEHHPCRSAPIPVYDHDDEPFIPAMPGLLGWLVALITAR